jgi:hypothetical protein
VGEGTNIIDIDFCIGDITENIFHNFLRIIRGAFKTHG